jgi:hypothetical protein
VVTDVSGDGQCDLLSGFDDWASTAPEPGVTVMTNLQLGFQCAATFEDGLVNRSLVEWNELDYATAVDRLPTVP